MQITLNRNESWDNDTYILKFELGKDYRLPMHNSFITIYNKTKYQDVVQYICTIVISKDGQLGVDIATLNVMISSFGFEVLDED